MKKFFALVLALVMALSLTTVAWGAAKTVYVKADFTGTSDGTETAPYTTLADAVTNAAAGDTIKLLSVATIDSAVTIEKEVTINGNGLTDAITIASGGTLTLGEGVTVTSSVNSIIYVLTGGTLLVEGATITSTATANTLVDVNGGAVTVSSGSVYSPKTTVFSVRNNGTLDIDGGSVYNTEAGDKVAAYAYGGGTINVNGGEVYSDTSSALRVMSKNGSTNGTINIYGGTIESDDGFVGVFADVGTINVYGGTIENIVDSTGGTVNIYGGDIAAVEKSYSTGAVNVYGGTFATAPAPEYIAPGYSFVGGAVAENSGTSYENLNGKKVNGDVVSDTLNLKLVVSPAKAPKYNKTTGELTDLGKVESAVIMVGNTQVAGTGTYVVVNSLSQLTNPADIVLYADAAMKIPAYYLKAVATDEYFEGVFFNNFGDDCGQVDYPNYDKRDTYFTAKGDLEGMIFVADEDGVMNAMYGGQLVAVDPVLYTVEDDAVDHTLAVTNKDGKTIAVKCSACGLNAVEVANVLSLPTGAKQIAGTLNSVWYWPSVAVSTPSTDKVTSAETFDAGIAMYVGMSVLAATGSAVVLKKREG